MEVKVLRKNGLRESYNDIKKVYNISSNLKSDKLCLQSYVDKDNRPSIMIDMSEILCYNCNDLLPPVVLNELIGEK